jgi:flagellar hook-associated protein 2
MKETQQLLPNQEELVTISFGSIATGLPKDIVKQIIAAEKIPVTKMEGRKGKIEEKRALVDELIGLVEGLSGHLAANANGRSLRELSVQANEEIVNVTADKNIAQPGSYQFEVVQLAQKSSAMTSGFENPADSYVGVGFVQYTLPNGETRDIYVDHENSSLEKIAKLINKDPRNGMHAHVVNDGSGSDTPWRMIMSLENTGDDENAQFPYFYFVDGEDDLFLEFEREARDAVVKLDGFEIELPENKTSDLIPGLNIDLKRAAPGEEFTIQISEDAEAISAKVVDLVEKINSILTFIKQQNALDESSDTSRTLGGDIALQSLESRIRSTVFKDIKTAFGYKRLSNLGISFQRDGLLKLEEGTLNNAINESYKSTAQILTGFISDEGVREKGFMDHLNDTTKTVLRTPDGLLKSRRKSLSANIDQMDRRIQQREKQLEQKEKNLKDKFARLEGTISKIKSQGAGIAALGAGAANPVTNLGGAV